MSIKTRLFCIIALFYVSKSKVNNFARPHTTDPQLQSDIASAYEALTQPSVYAITSEMCKGVRPKPPCRGKIWKSRLSSEAGPLHHCAKILRLSSDFLVNFWFLSEILGIFSEFLENFCSILTGFS